MTKRNPGRRRMDRKGRMMRSKRNERTAPPLLLPAINVTNDVTTTRKSKTLKELRKYAVGRAYMPSANIFSVISIQKMTVKMTSIISYTSAVFEPALGQVCVSVASKALPMMMIKSTTFSTQRCVINACARALYRSSLIDSLYIGIISPSLVIITPGMPLSALTTRTLEPKTACAQGPATSAEMSPSSLAPSFLSPVSATFCVCFSLSSSIILCLNDLSPDFRTLKGGVRRKRAASSAFSDIFKVSLGGSFMRPTETRKIFTANTSSTACFCKRCAFAAASLPPPPPRTGDVAICCVAVSGCPLCVEFVGHIDISSSSPLATLSPAIFFSMNLDFGNVSFTTFSSSFIFSIKSTRRINLVDFSFALDVSALNANVAFCITRLSLPSLDKTIASARSMASFNRNASISSCSNLSSSTSTNEHESIKIPNTSDRITVDRKIHAIMYNTTQSLPYATIVLQATANESSPVAMTNNVNALLGKLLKVRRSSSNVPKPVKSWKP